MPTNNGWRMRIAETRLGCIQDVDESSGQRLDLRVMMRRGHNLDQQKSAKPVQPHHAGRNAACHAVNCAHAVLAWRTICSRVHA